MAMFWTDSIVIRCSNVEVVKQWWIKTFDCKQVRLPNWDEPLPSDVALRLPDHTDPTILLSDRAEAEKAMLDGPLEHPILFCKKLQKAHEHLLGLGASPAPIQDGGDTQYFEVRDPEGNVIEICKEP